VTHMILHFRTCLFVGAESVMQRAAVLATHTHPHPHPYPSPPPPMSVLPHAAAKWRRKRIMTWTMMLWTPPTMMLTMMP
jgi:hypothetical protein